MKVLLAVCSHEVQHVGAIRSAYLIKQQDGDKFVDHWVTRGDVAREAFVRALLQDDEFGPEDAILLLDGDQRHPADLLERLRAHDLDMVCAHYYRRETNPVQSLCYELGDGRWPFLPMIHPPKDGLHEIAITGFGCVLIKKKVLQAVADTLPKGMSPIAIGPMPEIEGDHGNWGPDFRFFFKARALGFKLYLDASIESLHAVTLWLGHKSAEKLVDYTALADAAHALFLNRLELYGMHLEAFKQRKRILETRLEGLDQQATQMSARIEHGEDVPEQDQFDLTVAIYQMQGKVKEMEAWIEWAEKYPAITRPDQLPTTENTPKQETIPDEVADPLIAQARRQDAYRDNAIDLVSCLPEVGDGQ